MSGASWADAGAFVQSAASAASGYGAQAVALTQTGEAFVDSLTAPDFGLAPVSAAAPQPVYVPPEWVARTFATPALSGLHAGLTRPQPVSRVAWERFRHSDLGAFGAYEPTVAQSVPAFNWAMPAPPAQVSTGALEPAPQVRAPTAIQLPDVSGVDVPPPDAPPEWTATVEFDTSGAPGARPTLATLTAPQVTVPALPPVPQWSAPSEVTLSPVQLPTLSALDLPNVTAAAVPSLVLPELHGRLDFTDAPFDDAVVQDLVAQVRAVLGGRLAVPGHIWTRIWERVAADANRQYLARKREARRAHAKLGWSMPGGVLLEALQVAATEVNAEISARANEIAIKQAEMQQADYWQAMQQGVALTTLLSQIHNARQERLLKAAIATLDAQVTAYNAVVAAFNARVAAIAQDLAAKKLQLEGELAKLEVFKIEMEGAKLGVEVDQARVEMYVAQWNAVKTQAEAYEALVRGVSAQVEAQKAAVEAYGEQVKAQGTVVQMWATEWDAYAKKLEAERLKLGKFEAEARVFESQVSRYRAAIEGQSSRSGIQIEAKKLALQRAQIDATRYQADWGGEQTRLAGYEAYLKREGFPLEAARINAGIYQAQVQGSLGQVQAWLAPYDAYTKLLQKDAIRAQLQNSYAAMYGAFVQREGLGMERTKLEQDLLKTYEQLLQEYNKTLVAEHQAEAQYQLGQLDAQVRGWGVSAELYKADVQGQSVASQLQSDIYRTSVEISKANTDALVEGAKILTAQWQTAAQITQAQLQASASVYAQLGAAAYAATNASISNSGSYGYSESDSVSTNYNYSMQG